MCRSRKALAEPNGKLAGGGGPLESSWLAQAGILDRNVKQLLRRIVVRKAAAGHYFPQTLTTGLQVRAEQVALRLAD